MFYAEPFIFSAHMHAIYIMPSHNLKRKHADSDVSATDTHASISQGDLANTSSLCQQPMHIVGRTTHLSPTMLSDPISSPSSCHKQTSFLLRRHIGLPRFPFSLSFPPPKPVYDTILSCSRVRHDLVLFSCTIRSCLVLTHDTI